MSVSRRCSTLTALIAAMLVLGGCVSQEKYNAQVQKNDALQTRYDQLNQTMSSEISSKEMHIERLQNAIKVTVNDQRLFPSGDWQMPATAQQTIAKMVPILAPMQQTKIAVNGYFYNVPIGPGLKRQGVTTNLFDTVAEACRKCDAVHDRTGSQPCLNLLARIRRGRSLGFQRYAGGT